jgi:hypothetical protein
MILREREGKVEKRFFFDSPIDEEKEKKNVNVKLNPVCIIKQ